MLERAVGSGGSRLGLGATEVAATLEDLGDGKTRQGCATGNVEKI